MMHKGLCFVFLFLMILPLVRAEDQTQQPVQPPNHLSSVEGEIVEINELKEPPGSAVYKVKVFETGETLELFAHPDRSLILAGNEIKNATDVLGGTKATIVYGQAKEQNLPVIVFARLTSTITTGSV